MKREARWESAREEVFTGNPPRLRMNDSRQIRFV